MKTGKIYAIKKKNKTLIKQKKKNYFRSKVFQIEGLKSYRPKELWKYFRHDNNSCRNSLSSDDFFNYFSSLESKIDQCENEEAENFNLSHDFDDLSYFFPELDSRITQSEILAAAKRLQAGKAYGNDDMLNEYFIETIDIIAPHLCDIFNSILDSGIFPKKWCEGIIIPPFKKGDRNCPSNYRGITLLSCFSKLFTTVMNKRLELFCDENNSRFDAQFGFRKDRSTIDAMFTLLNLVQNFLNKNKRL